MMEKKILWILCGSAALVLLLAVVFIYFGPSTSSFHGSVITPPVQVSEFRLIDQNGQSFSLSSQRGKLVMLFFGFTNCTDVCPATLAILRQVVRDLDTQATKVQVVFVTTDPARDTPAKLAVYLSAYNPSFIGLTGSQAELQPVWKEYGVTVMDNGETHSSYIYLIDGAGHLRLTYSTGFSPGDILADVRSILKGE